MCVVAFEVVSVVVMVLVVVFIEFLAGGLRVGGIRVGVVGSSGVGDGGVLILVGVIFGALAHSLPSICIGHCCCYCCFEGCCGGGVVRHCGSGVSVHNIKTQNTKRKHSRNMKFWGIL